MTNAGPSIDRILSARRPGRRRFVAQATALAAATLGRPLARAQGYPSKPITLLVPYAAGGAADFVARVVSERAGTLLGQPFVIETRPGAGGSIAAAAVAKSAPDGHTVLLTSVAIPAVNPHLMKLAFDPVTDLATVAVVATGYTALVVPVASPFKTVADLVAFGKQNHDKIFYGTSGNASITHLTAELFCAAAGIKAQHVPYKGNPAVIADLVGGRLHFTFDGAWKANADNGLVRVLAYTGPRRPAAMPGVPTLQEAGLPNYVGFEPWIGFAVAGGTPPAIADRLGEALLRAAAEPDVTAKLEASGFERRALTRREIGEIIRRDHQVIGDLIQRQGIKP